MPVKDRQSSEFDSNLKIFDAKFVNFTFPKKIVKDGNALKNVNK